MLIAIASSILGLASTAPVGSSPSTIPIAVASGVGAAVVALLGQFLLRKQTKDKLIAEASDELIGGAKTLLAEYRRELERAKGEVARLQERVERLEVDLVAAKKQRDRIEQERLLAIWDLGRVQQRVDDLEKRLALLQRRNPPGTG